MKVIRFMLFILLGCSWSSVVWAQPVEDSLVARPWKLDFDFSSGLCTGVDVQTKDAWKSGFNSAVGLNYYRTLTPELMLRIGISEQFAFTTQRLEHPEPYAMSMNSYLYTQSTRLNACFDYGLPRLRQQIDSNFFVGGGLYGDLLHVARLDTKRYYISGSVADTLHIKDSFPAIVPGYQLQAGIRGRLLKLELRYWEDLKTFTMPTVPVGKQKRTGVVLSLSWFYNPAPLPRAD